MHRYRVVLAFVFIAVLAALLLPARAQKNSETEIRKVLEDQAAAWNRGDIDGYMQGYDRSPRTAIVGSKVEYGYDLIRDRYKSAYSNPAIMGKLSLTNLAVRMLGENYAVVTGNFHLERAPSAGGDGGGIFSLVLAKTPAGWRVILDHTTGS